MADVLSEAERRELLDAPRPRRSLPLATDSALGLRLPLAPAARSIDLEYRPTYCVWELTLKCDLTCRHCGSRAGAARSDELSLDEALDLVRQLAALGVKEVTLIGGEAYLYEGWTEVVREIRRQGMDSTLVSGGRGLDPARAEAAAQAGVQSLAVSIDGDEACHDRLRGTTGSWQSAWRALANCRRAGIQIAVNTQVNRLSLPHLHDIAERLIDVGAHGWQLQLTVPMGRAADEPEVILQPYDLLELFPILVELKRRCDAARVKLVTGNNIGYFGPYDHVLRQHMPCGHSTHCVAGRYGIGIEAGGNIKGCPSLPSNLWVGGNIREHSLADIWERSAPLRYNRDRTEADLWGFCASCYYADECRAGCTWMSTSLLGKPGNNPYCHHRALELQKRGLRERVRAVHAAPGLPFDHGRFAIITEPFAAD